MITIYNPQGRALLQVQERDDSKYSYTLMGEHYVSVSFDWDRHIPLPYGSYINYNGKRWTLFADYIPTQTANSIEYRVSFYAPVVELKNRLFFYLSGGGREVEWTMTGTIQQFIRELQQNLQGDNWTITTTLSGSSLSLAKAITISRQSIGESLSKIAEAFSTEWHSEDKHIVFGTKTVGGTITAELGALASVYTPQGEETRHISRLYAFGSTKNLSPNYRKANNATISKIGELRLRLPSGTDYIQGVARGIEHVEYFEDIYPSYVGTISEVSSRQSKDDVIYKVKDKALYISQKYLLPNGQSFKIRFESGALQGMDFDAKIVSDGYELVPNDSYGVRLPSGSLVPNAGDKYAPYNFDISLVDAEYLRRAESRLLAEATAWLQKNNSDRRDVEVQCNPVYVEQHGIYPELGQAVRLKQAIPSGDKLGRITKIEYPLYCPQLITFVVGDAKPVNRLEALGELAKQEGERARSLSLTQHQEAIRYSARYYQDALGTSEALEGLVDSLGDRFVSAISPVVLKTMQTLVGSEATQFAFVKSTSGSETIKPNISYLSGTKVLKVIGTHIIRHYTIGISSITGNRPLSAYKHWTLSAYTSTSLSEENASYYLYASVSKSNNTGTFSVQREALPFEESSRYNLLVGIIGAEDNEGNRSISPVYGFTEILPSRITTGKIVSNDGGTYFDLERGEIGGNIRFRGDDIDTVVNKLITPKMDSLQIGGRNYVRRQYNNKTQDGQSHNVRLTETLPAGTYTFSCYAEILRNGQYISVLPYNNNGRDFLYGQSFIHIPTPNESSGIYTGTIVADRPFHGLNIYPQYASANAGQGGLVLFRWIKLERGNKATDYTLAPEDVEEQMTTKANTALGEAKQYSNTKAQEANTYTNQKHSEVKHYATQEANKALNDAKHFAQQEDQKLKEQVLNDYLHKVIREGSTEVAGGLVSTNIIAMKDLDGNVRSYIDGRGTDAAFVAGVEHFGKPNQSENVLIKHNGDARFGKLHIDRSGVLNVIDRGRSILAIGGQAKSLAMLLDSQGANGLEQTLPSYSRVSHYAGAEELDERELYRLSITKTSRQLSLKARLESMVSISEEILADRPDYRRQMASASTSLQLDYRASPQYPWRSLESWTALTASNRQNPNTREVELINKTFSDIPSGEYRLMAISRHSGDIYNAVYLASNISELSIASQGDYTETLFARDAFYIAYGLNQLLYFDKSNGLVIRGKTDTPGVLASGRVSSTGQIVADSSWGAKAYESQQARPRAELDRDWYYIVHHSIGHTDYSVQLTPFNTHNTPSIIELAPTFFKCCFWGNDDGRRYKHEFCYVCLGNNH